MEIMRNTIDEITNKIDDGLIFIDQDRHFRVFNEKAKKILGVWIENINAHPKGQIQKGDIVIMIDNMLGVDDGGVQIHHLNLLNIHDAKILPNDLLIAVGTYMSEHKPVYKHVKIKGAPNIEIDNQFLGIHIKAGINLENKITYIEVEGIRYELKYHISTGHMVILDSKTKKVKFFQERGYTVRRESIADILEGRKFREKGKEHTQIDVFKARLDDIIEYDEIIEEIDNILKGKVDHIIDKYYKINKRLTICSLHRIETSNESWGVLLKICDASDLSKLIDERNRIIEMSEREREIVLSMHNVGEEHFKDFKSKSYLMDNVKELAIRASKVKTNILLTGESGVGKSFLAKEIHNAYNSDAPFIEVNCSSIPQSLFESEMFGYVKGAFTGALMNGKKGYFSAANGGTIFLDEMGEISMEAQVKLLHVVQNKSFFPVGSETPVSCDVRVIAATNKDLQKKVEEGKFREDLFYRLNIFTIHVPPLRDRKEDIYHIAHNFIVNKCIEYGVTPKNLSGEALNFLLNFHFPGNVRQLENIIEKAILMCDGDIIYREHLDAQSEKSLEVTPNNTFHTTLKDQMEEREKTIISIALRRNEGNRKKTMEELQISKTSFYEKLNKYHL